MKYIYSILVFLLGLILPYFFMLGLILLSYAGDVIIGLYLIGIFILCVFLGFLFRKKKYLLYVYIISLALGTIIVIYEFY
jgi:hypothetical protein